MAYIPENHKKYDLLPNLIKNGGEVFSYPTELVDKVSSYYPSDEHFIPYGYDSYQEYYDYLDKHKREATDPKLIELLNELRREIECYNKKEDWSVCRYIGSTTSLISGLQNGKCYYWPCCADNPVYEGVIDDEEFTSYWYATSPELWEILEDPTGMAYATIYNQDKHNSKEYFNGVMKALNGENWSDV